MNRKIIVVFIVSLFSMGIHAQEIVLKKGMVIRKTSKVKRSTYAIDAFDSLQKAAIIIEGNNITVDFNKAVIKGSAGKTFPDKFFGTAVLIRKGKNITIKNLAAKSFKVALMVEGVEGLTIENCDFSYNYRSNLNDFEEKLLLHWSYANKNNEWLSFGVAMYLKNCDRATVKNCKVTGGQNALLLTQCNNGQFYNNDFSFNSGIGIGMYHCNGNRVLYNKLNFNIRDNSAVEYMGRNNGGIMLYGQSNYNTIYKNSVTHCGDGVFLGGLDFDDSAQVTSEGNRIWSNDLSYSPDCGIKADFSSCFIYDNRVFECNRGIRGSGIYHTVIANNKFRNNNTAIAIQNGVHVQIEGNIFLGDKEAISLWKKQPPAPDRNYSKYKDARSAGYVIHLNSFNQNPFAYRISMTDSVRIYNNRYSFVDEMFRIDSTVTNIDSLPVEPVDTAMGFPFVKDPSNPFKGSGKFAGRDKIMITRWGPYDFGYPLIRYVKPADSAHVMEFEIVGPKGKWTVVSAKEIELQKKTDTLPSRLKGVVTGEEWKVEIILEYRGPAFTDEFGNKIPANKPYRFVYRSILRN
jgi:hypothetical protein